MIRDSDKMYLVVAGGGGGAALKDSIGGPGGAGESLVGGTDVKLDPEDGLGGTETKVGSAGQGVYFSPGVVDSLVRAARIAEFGDRAGGDAALESGGGGGGGGHFGGGGGNARSFKISGGSGGGGSSFVSHLRSGKFINLPEAIYGDGKVTFEIGY